LDFRVGQRRVGEDSDSGALEGQFQVEGPGRRRRLAAQAGAMTAQNAAELPLLPHRSTLLIAQAQIVDELAGLPSDSERAEHLLRQLADINITIERLAVGDSNR
jgi:hypothetical protein